MKKLKWPLLFVALCSIGAAFANASSHASPAVIHKYSFRSRSTDGTRMYYNIDLTQMGYVLGIDYNCENANYTCTFQGDPTREHLDFNGFFFYTSDIPVSGINNSGFFIDND